MAPFAVAVSPVPGAGPGGPGVRKAPEGSCAMGQWDGEVRFHRGFFLPFCKTQNVPARRRHRHLFLRFGKARRAERGLAPSAHVPQVK